MKLRIIKFSVKQFQGSNARYSRQLIELYHGTKLVQRAESNPVIFHICTRTRALYQLTNGKHIGLPCETAINERLESLVFFSILKKKYSPLL